MRTRRELITLLGGAAMDAAAPVPECSARSH